jgi:beta-lactam-binding protein with PASTA domain
VPGVQGKTLADAEALLTRTHCGVGTVKHVFSLRAQKGRVISQNPTAHWRLVNGTVDLVVGKGRRKSHHG